MAFKSLLEEGMDPQIKMEEQESASPEPGEERERAVLPKTERSSEQAEQKVKEEPVEGPSGNWDAQFQEFLRTLQAPCSGEENSQLSEQSPKVSQDTADAHKWPRGLWASPTLPYLPGAAQPELKVHLVVPPGEKGREGSVAAGAAAVEMQRQRFRTFCYQETDGPRELCRQLQALCHQWLKPERNTKEQMLELVTLEQFVTALPLDMQNWLRENGPESCAQAVGLAEGFLLRQQEAKGWGQQTTGVTEAKHANPTGANQALPDVKMPLSSGAEREQDGSTSSLAGDRWLSENEEQKPFAESPERMEQLRVLLKTDKAILGQREADENQHSQSSHVVTHESTVKTEKSYKCWHCGQSFINITDLLTHERTHIAGDRWLSENEEQKPVAESPEKMEQLQVLEKTDRGKAILHQGEADENGHGQSSHVVTSESTVREEKSYKCWHCGQSFSSSTDLLTHERTHVGEKMYKCPHCGERERMRMGQKLNKCSHCGNTLGWNPRGRIHVVQKPYTISECRKEYMQISDFLNHQRIHEQKNVYTCSKCGENFESYMGLKAHRRTHTSESQYKCSHCGMCFNWSSHLRLHERIHTAVCSYCGKNFSQKSELVEHEKTHAAEGSFACFTCGKTFAVSSELAAHVRTYAEKSLKCLVTGKSFQCSECGDSFNHNSALTVHQKIHTGKKS